MVSVSHHSKSQNIQGRTRFSVLCITFSLMAYLHMSLTVQLKHVNIFGNIMEHKSVSMGFEWQLSKDLKMRPRTAAHLHDP